jgi:peptide/nickel transport system substrate-binding protein
MKSLNGTRRRDLLLAGASGALWLPRSLRADHAPVRGGTLVIGPGPELTTPLTSAVTTAGLAQLVSGKVFDGLMTYDEQLRPVPQLATSWTQSRDGRTLTFRLRPGVTWHDGHPFGSADVAFSVEVWRKHHSRGRSTFAFVDAVDTPDARTVVFRLSQPCPYLMTVLMSPVEAQVIPKHVYGGGDILANPAVNAPIGTGPFRFVRWDRGSQIVLERNPRYWDAPKPHLDRVVLRFSPNASANVAALESGGLHVATLLPLGEVERVSRNPRLTVVRKARSYATGVSALGFNLERPVFRDVRVRRAFAHALDRDFIVKNIFFGHATAIDSPIPPAFADFATNDVPRYAFDLKRAEQLLEEAGLRRGAGGIRLTVTNDQAPTGPLPAVAQHLRSNLARIGVQLQLRTQDFGQFVNRVYTRRDFDTAFYSGNAGPDPAIGTQRFYWSKNIQPGVAFSNAEAYANPEVDRLLEAGQVETDPVKRRQLYVDFQRLVQTDLPRVPFVSTEALLVIDRRVGGLPPIDPVSGNLADAFLRPASS